MSSATPSRCRSCRWATSSSACSRRAATTSTRPRPTTRPTSPRRTATSRSISGCGTTSARTRSCIWASTATSNGCPARPPPCRPTACPRRCWARCRISTRSSSTIPARARQAKRRAAAVIVDHLTPPLTRAESWGELAELEALVDEYHEAASLDPRRLPHLRAAHPRPQRGARASTATSVSTAARRRASMLAPPRRHLCELKELQIRDGLHVFGRARMASRASTCWWPWLRAPRGARRAAATPRCCARWRHDLRLDWDPARRRARRSLDGSAACRAARGAGPWRTRGRHGRAAGAAGAAAWSPANRAAEPGWTATRAVLDEVERRLAPGARRAAAGWSSRACSRGLDGRRVPPGPSGAPTRGRPEVLPTGRNFYSVDCRAVPTPAAWRLGWRSAGLVVEQYLQRHGAWPRQVALSAWGTANMRTGGDDIAQALALMGCRPVWDERQPAGDRRRGAAARRCSAGRGSTSRCASPASSATPSRPRSSCSTTPCGRWRGLDEPEADNPLAAAAPRRGPRLEATGLCRTEPLGGGRPRASSAASPAPTAPACRR